MTTRLQIPDELEVAPVSRVALLGEDYRGLAIEVLCEVGDEVRAGAPLLRDARQSGRGINAPVGGRISRIERGPRRRLEFVQIDIDDSFEPVEFEPPHGEDRDSMRGFMLETGTWSSLRTRPFGNIPLPDAEPAAVFVTALDAEPMAPDPRALIDELRAEFAAGIGALKSIADAPLYVCHAPDHDPGLEARDGLRCVPFAGGPGAGLPGVHIHALCPIGFAGGEVWQLGYQDVIALGWLLLRSRPWPWRLISIGGWGRQARSLAVPPGAAVDELLAGESIDASLQILAGSAIYGKPMSAAARFLKAGQRQITLLGPDAARRQPADGRGKAIIPGDWLEKFAPPGIYPVPLMRALQLGDAERARDLGALELLEEDVAPLSSACVSNNDYGSLLRRVLDELEVSR